MKTLFPLPFWPNLNYGVCRIHWNGIRLGRCVKWTESNGRADGRIELHSPLVEDVPFTLPKIRKRRVTKPPRLKRSNDNHSPLSWIKTTYVTICIYFKRCPITKSWDYHAILFSLAWFSKIVSNSKKYYYTPPKPKTQGLEKGYIKACTNIT